MAQLPIKRALFNVLWLIILLGISVAYIFLPFALFQHVSPWYLWFLITFGPLLIFQAPIHWLLLNHFYPQMRGSNLYWVLAMPALFFFCFWLMILMLLIITQPQFG